MNRKRRSTERQVLQRRKLFRHAMMERLENRELLACDLYSSLHGELQQKLEGIQSIVDNAISIGGQVPILGDKIVEVGKFVDGFSSQLVEAVKSLSPDAIEGVVADKLAEALGPGGLGILRNRDANPEINGQDIQVQFGSPSNSCSVTVGMHLGLDLAAVNLSGSAKLDLGLPALPFNVSATSGVEAKVSFDWPDFKFTLDSNEGVIFDFSPETDITVQVEAGLTPGTQLDAELGFLKAYVQDGVDLDSNGSVELESMLHAGFQIDLTLDNGSFNFNVEVDTGATIALHVGAMIDEDFPSISADFVMQWYGFEASDPEPSVGFYNVEIDMGSFLTDLLKPVVEVINETTEPLKPIIDVITEPIPVLSDISKEAGLGPVSILSLAKVANDFMPASGYKEIIEIATVVVDVLNIIYDFDTQGTGLVFKVGDILLTGDNDGDGVSENGDLRFDQPPAKSLKGSVDSDNLTSLTTAQAALINIKEAVENADLPPELEGAREKLIDVINRFSSGYSYSFPILDNPLGSIGKLLVGQDADLFEFRASAVLNAESKLAAPLGFGLDVIVEGNIDVDSYVQIGFDTFGLRKFLQRGLDTGTFDGIDLLDGLFISRDTRIHLDGGFAAGVGVSYVAFEGSVTGGVWGGLHLDMPDESFLNSTKNIFDDDPSNDYVDGDPSKIRPFSELNKCLFAVDGNLNAGLEAKIKVGVDFLSVDFEWKIAEVEIFSFDVNCVPNPFHQDAPQLASLAPDGTLTLYVGPQAINRTGFKPEDIHEKYTLTAGYPRLSEVDSLPPGDIIEISAFDMRQRFVGVKKIVADAGNGNDIIKIFQSSAPNAPVISSSIDINGGSGNDVILYEGNGAAVIRGGTGNDRLTGGSGNNLIFGEEGNDIIFGGSGLNLLNGGDGADVITGGSGTNYMGAFSTAGLTLTEDGNDDLIGGTGQNYMYGGAGDDVLQAGPMTDYLRGDDGNDILRAGKGSASFLGGRGDDQIVWEVGNGMPLLINGGAPDREKNTLSLGGSSAVDLVEFSRYLSTNRLQVTGLTGEPMVAINMHNVLFEGLGGADEIIVQPLTNTTIQNVGINLSDVLNSKFGLGDNAKDKITVYGRDVADTVVVEKEIAAIQAPQAPKEPNGEHPLPLYGGIMKVTRIPNYVVRLANVEDNFLLDTKGGFDNVTVKSMTGPTTIDTGDGNDTVTVQAADPGVAGSDILTPDYMHQLHIEFGGGKNKLVVDQTASKIPVTTSYEMFAVQSDLLPGVLFSATGGDMTLGVQLYSGKYDDKFYVTRTLPSVPVTIGTGDGDDEVKVGSAVPHAAGHLGFIRGPLNVDTGAGSNRLFLYDNSSASGNANVVVNGNKIIGFAGPADDVLIQHAISSDLTVELHGSNLIADTFRLIQPFAQVNIFGNGGDDIVRVNSAIRAVKVVAGVGNDTVELGTSFNTMDPISTQVTFFGGAGFDKMNVTDAQSAAAQNYVMGLNSFYRDGGASMTFDSSLEQFNFVGSAFNDTVTVQAMPNSVTQANLSGHNGGADKLVGPNLTNLWQITGSNAGTLNSTINFSKFQMLEGGFAADTFRLSESFGVTGSIDGGGGIDSLDFSPYTTEVFVNVESKSATKVPAWNSLERFVGGSQADRLFGPNLINTWTVENADSGTLSTMALGNLKFTSFGSLIGGTGIDVFKFHQNGSLSGLLNDLGGTGDVLDYSQVSTPVIVNLNSKSASRIAQSVNGIENIQGGSGNDVLIGNDSNNIIYGGAGDDIIMGRGGDDHLFGDAGMDIVLGGDGADVLHGGIGEDILIGNRVTFESNLDRVRTVQTEWLDLTKPILNRVNKIRQGFPNPATGLNATTVLDDGSQDTMVGSDGIDWFFATLGGGSLDTIIDLMPDEFLN